MSDTGNAREPWWTIAKESLAEYEPVKGYEDAALYWDHETLKRERNGWIWNSRGGTTERYSLLDRFSSRIYADEKGEQHDVFDWVDRMKTYTFRPFVFRFYQVTDEGDGRGWYHALDKYEVRDMRVAAFSEEEAMRIATARVIYWKTPARFEISSVSPCLEIESYEDEDETLEGFAFQESANLNIYLRKEPKEDLVYDRTNALRYFKFLDDFARKFSKDRHLYPVNETIRRIYWQSEFCERAPTWTPEKNAVDWFDPYMLSAKRIKETEEAIAEGVIRNKGVSIRYCRKQNA